MADKDKPLCPLIPTKEPTATVQTATFGMVPGVIRTRVGYCGGKEPYPTYANIKDHTETIQIEFNPEELSYPKLLEMFWDGHNGYAPKWRRQYMSGCWYQNDEQKKAIEKSLKSLPASYGDKEVQTEITQLGDFYLAEEYHQKYLKRDLLDAHTLF